MASYNTILLCGDGTPGNNRTYDTQVSSTDPDCDAKVNQFRKEMNLPFEAAPLAEDDSALTGTVIYTPPKSSPEPASVSAIFPEETKRDSLLQNLNYVFDRSFQPYTLEELTKTEYGFVDPRDDQAAKAFKKFDQKLDSLTIAQLEMVSICTELINLLAEKLRGSGKPTEADILAFIDAASTNTFPVGDAPFLIKEIARTLLGEGCVVAPDRKSLMRIAADALAEAQSILNGSNTAHDVTPLPKSKTPFKVYSEALSRSNDGDAAIKELNEYLAILKM